MSGIYSGETWAYVTDVGKQRREEEKGALHKLGTQISGRDGIQAVGGDTNLTLEKRHPSLHGTRGKGGGRFRRK